MDIEITNKVENKLLGRTQITFRIRYKGPTPSIKEVRSSLISKLKADEKLFVIDNVKSEFGATTASGYAKIYTSADAMKIEADHVIRKNFEKKEEASKDSDKAEKAEGEGKPAEKEKEEEKPEKKKDKSEEKEEKPKGEKGDKPTEKDAGKDSKEGG